MRTVKNRFLEAKTVRDIDDQVSKILRGLGNPTDHVDLADVRTLLELDRHYYSSQDDSLLREVVSKLMIAGKQVLHRPSLLLDAVKKFKVQALWIPDRRRILIDSSLPEPKWRWNEAHEIIHSVVPWHAGAMMGDDQYSLTPGGHEQVESEANYGAGRLLFLQGVFDEYVKSSKPTFDLVQGAKKDFGNTLTTTFWRVVESLDTPALGVILLPAVAMSQTRPEALNKGSWRFQATHPLGSCGTVKFPLGINGFREITSPNRSF